ncbi:MAG: hypothetical protein M1486_02590, partial [Gammaproteobacteria bacterium]|nr:hypothetical protein [Gammaproteobacteria bacterium]
AAEDISYHIPISMLNEDRQSFSLKSLEKAAVSVIDEINSSPFAERWFNDLFMGINPVTKKYPETPGSLMFLTQNPVTMAGRQRPSNALSRRVITYTLPPYPPEEMVSIIMNEGVEANLAEKMVEIYINLVNYAHRKYLTPAPTFRNLLRLARIASNSKQKEALDNFFTKVQIPELRLALLQAEKRFKSNTVLALIQHMTPEISALFELNIDLFESFILKAMSEEKVQFMLQALLLLNKGFGAWDKEKAKYFELMSNLPLDEIENISSLNLFFCNKPNSISEYFRKSSTIELSVLVQFIHLFNDYPELIAAILINEQVDSKTLQSYSKESTFYMCRLNSYCNVHPDAEGHCLESVLKLARFIKIPESNRYASWHNALSLAKPNIVTWLASLINENDVQVDALTMISLLTIINKEEQTRLLSQNPLYLDAVIVRSSNHLKARFLLESLSLIHNVPDLLDVERVKYFEILRDLDVKYPKQHDQILDVLSQDSALWPIFFKKIHALPLKKVLIFFITFKNNPELISGLDLVSNELIEQFDYLSNFPELNNAICTQFKDSPQSSQGIRELVSYLAQNLPDESLYTKKNEQLLMEVSPKEVEFIVNSINHKNDRIVPRQLINLLEYLTEELITFFEQNPSVLDTLLTSEMSPETAKLSLYTLNLLFKINGLSNPKTKDYYQQLTQIPIKRAYLEDLDKFLSSEPKALNAVLSFSELHPSSLEKFLFFTHIFNQFPKLIKELLSDHDFSAEFFSAHTKDSPVYTQLINNYTRQHPDISESTLHDLLRVAYYLRESGVEDNKLWVHNIASINPNKIKLIATLLKRDKTQINYNNIIPMLQHVSEETLVFFEEQNSIFDKLISKNISASNIKFLLRFLHLLLDKEGEQPIEIINYFNQIVDFPFGKFYFYYEPLMVFFAKMPELIPHLLKKSKFVDGDSLMQLVATLIDFPDLLNKILKEDVDPRLIKSTGDIRILYTPLLKNYVGKHSNVSTECLEQVLELAKYLNSHSNAQRNLWQPIIENANPDKIKKLSGWITEYSPNVVLNLICSKADRRIFTNPSLAKEHFIIKFTKQLLNNISTVFFDFSKPFRFDKERAMFLHHLEQETFVVAGDDASLWTKEKNDALLQQAYANYTSLFSKEAQKKNTEVLLMVSKELSEVSRDSGYSIANTVTKDLNNTISGYQGCFWIRTQRKESAASLKKLINQKNMDYPKILQAISNARNDVFTNDTQKERNMHRFGSSRYYDTLNKLEEILITVWVQDKDAISGFKAYLPYYEKTLAHNKKSINDAIQHELLKKNKKYNYQTAFNNCPGYIRALAKEAMTREKVLEHYYEATKSEDSACIIIN